MKKIIIIIVSILIIGIVGLFIFYKLNDSFLGVDFNNEETTINEEEETTETEEDYENYIESMEQQIVDLKEEESEAILETGPQSVKDFHNKVKELKEKDLYKYFYEKDIYFNVLDTIIKNSLFWGLDYDGTQKHYSTIKPYLSKDFIEKYKDKSSGILEKDITNLLYTNFNLSDMTFDIFYMENDIYNTSKYKIDWVYEKSEFSDEMLYKINDAKLIFDTGITGLTPIYLDNATLYILKLLEKGYKTSFDVYKNYAEKVEENKKLNDNFIYQPTEKILEKYPECKILSDSIDNDSEIIDFNSWDDESDDYNWDRDYIKLALTIKNINDETYKYYYIINYKRGENCSLIDLDYSMKKKTKVIVKSADKEETTNNEENN